MRESFLRLRIIFLATMLLTLAAASICSASTKAPASNTHPIDAAVPALMLSDIHFDPFFTPGRISRLASAPVSDWPSILEVPPSIDEEAAFAKVQSQCSARGVDTKFTLLHESLRQARLQEPDAKFITVSGDLVAHAFPCKYKAVFPTSTQDQYQAFVVKTVSFVMAELHAAFPSAAVYLALGNNDSACGDYQFDPASSFLSQTAGIIASGLPAAAQPTAQSQFAAGGHYSLVMAAPLRNTRLIVLNDVFLSAKYRTCAGGSDSSPGAAEIAWLGQQLSQARQAHQNVWLMGHIPPGVDVYSTLRKFRDVCGSEGPEMFLSSTALPGALSAYGDIIRIALFGHTHMDEMRVVQPGTVATGEKGVPVKLVPSISPVDGNRPSFTIAQVNPATAELEDFAVIAAPDSSGTGTWAKEYDYSQAYHEQAFTSEAVQRLVSAFAVDHDVSTPASRQYVRDYFVGGLPELKSFWPQYTCALDHLTAKEYSSCVCLGGRQPVKEK